MGLKHMIKPILLLVMSVCILRAQQNEQVVDKIIAKINNQVVLKSELESEYLNAVSSGRKTSLCDMLELLITNKILVAKAELDSVILGEDEIDYELDRRFAFYIAQIGSESKIEELYGKPVSKIKQELREDIRDQLLVGKVKDAFHEKVNVTPQDVKSFFDKIPSQDLPYYSAEVRIGQILRKPKPGAEAEKRARTQALQLRERILAGEDFSSLARQYSADPSAAGNNGDLGFFKRGELSPAYERVALTLQKGEVSMPVRSIFGYHIIELLEIRGSAYNSRHILIRVSPSEEDIRASQDFLSTLRDKILREDTLSFEKAARLYSDDKQTNINGGFLMDEKRSSLLPMEKIDPFLFFSIDTMALGSISPPLRHITDDGSTTLRLLYYKEKIPAHQASFDQDYIKLSEAAQKEKIEESINDWLKTAYQKVFIHIKEEFDHCDISQNLKRKKMKLPNDDKDGANLFREICTRLKNEAKKVIVGQEDIIDLLMISLFCQGHSLLVGVPGLAKTLLVQTMAQALDLSFHRIQFTPDLMPSDILGSEVMDKDKNMEFILGPIFAQIILADEINRTPPKTQAALLEAMQEHAVTIGGKNYPLEEPFFVLATQNPIEQEGTYPLPEAQLDRFMFEIRLGYPAFDAEVNIVQNTTSDKTQHVDKVLEKSEILYFQQLIRKVPVSKFVIEYAVRLVQSTRPHTDPPSKTATQYLEWGAGPRGSQYLVMGAKCHALLRGKYSPDIEDIQAVAAPVLRHRMFRNFKAAAENISEEHIIQELL